MVGVADGRRIGGAIGRVAWPLAPGESPLPVDGDTDSVGGCVAPLGTVHVPSCCQPDARPPVVCRAYPYPLLASAKPAWNVIARRGRTVSLAAGGHSVFFATGALACRLFVAALRIGYAYLLCRCSALRSPRSPRRTPSPCGRYLRTLHSVAAPSSPPTRLHAHFPYARTDRQPPTTRTAEPGTRSQAWSPPVRMPCGWRCGAEPTAAIVFVVVEIP